MKRWWMMVLVALCVAVPARAEAFCGFYVAGADAKLFNNATLVVMMRDGQRTVLSLQNNYQGPPQNFAMVVPVPVVLQKENVKTLPNEIFARVDKLAAPRLVEYWEMDPCAPDYRYAVKSAEGAAFDDDDDDAEDSAGGVKIEAQFVVGEYEIVILSASDSTGLDSWLKAKGYRIPEGAEPLLRPYVQSGMKFFVAKVDVSKVKFENGQAMLSPLRFHYDDSELRLPVRLGLMNSQGTQDLIVHILASERYEVANYENVAIPTNVDLDEQAKHRFGAFYAALFDATLRAHPRSVITEYAWDASSCDPCPEPPLDEEEIATLGGDVLSNASGMVLTRLHARYDKSVIGEDLVFKQAEPIVGGREMRSGDKDQLERGAKPGSYNNFQGRYAIRHPWTGAINCENPIRNRWGGPPDGGEPEAKPALNLAFAPRGGVDLAAFVKDDLSDYDIDMTPPPPPPPSVPSDPVVATPVPNTPPPPSGCGGCGVAGANADWSWLVVLALGLLGRRRLRRSSR